jgi:hypothetical protein
MMKKFVKESIKNAQKKKNPDKMIIIIKKIERIR